jgi:hypothetical protein
MKKLVFSIISLSLILLYSCSKEDLIQQDQMGDLKSLSCNKDGLKMPKGPVFTVYPNGTDDTQAFTNAFNDAKAAGPGATVKLSEGLFKIGFVEEICDFNGYFLGAGKEKTIISNLPDLPCEEALFDNLNPTLLAFTGGNIIMSDMTIRTNDGDPCAYGPVNESFYGDLCDVVVFSDFSSHYVPAYRHINVVVDNVDFIIGSDGGHGVYATPGNVAMPIFIGGNFISPTGNEPLTSGNFSIKRCKFDQGMTGPDLFGLDENSVVNIENNIIMGGSQQIFIGAFYGTQTTIKNNKFRNSTWIDIFIAENEWGSWGYYPNEIPIKRAKFTIIGNDFKSPPGIISLYMKDYYRTVLPDNEFPQLFDVNFNTFNTQEGGIAIQSLNNIDAKIWNNKFSGNGAVGVMVEGDEATGTYAENIKLMGNNFMKANYTDAAVSLGPYTKNCMVVGVATDKVVDLGVNNKVIGVKAQKKGPNYHPEMHGHLKSMQESTMRMRLLHAN